MIVRTEFTSSLRINGRGQANRNGFDLRARCRFDEARANLLSIRRFRFVCSLGFT
jgi:hypothetical protein